MPSHFESDESDVALMEQEFCRNWQRFASLRSDVGIMFVSSIPLVTILSDRHTPRRHEWVLNRCAERDSLLPGVTGVASKALFEAARIFLMTSRSRYRCVPLFGPPGVGKGTQGGILAHIPGFFHLSVGDVFRSIDIGSPNGREVYKHISRGELVPDELTIRIWRKAVEAYVALSWFKPREDLLILDGMPRNVNQVQLVQEYLEIHRVIYLKCSDEEDMVHRIRRRAIRENRTDDANEDIIRRRFDIYREVTAPVLQQYDPAIIHEVDANGSPAQVLRSILDCLIPVQNELFKANKVEEDDEQVSR